MSLSDPLQTEIACFTCAIPAIAATVYRLYVRWGRIWWDDAWAFLSMLSTFVQLAGVIMHAWNPDKISQHNQVAAWYITAMSFYAIIWCARISILLSVIRIDPSQYRRKRLLLLAVIFLIVMVLLMVELLAVCERQNWKEELSPHCSMTHLIAISQLITDVLSDVVLIVAPLQLLSGFQDKAVRRRLIAIFSTCIATTIASLAHAILIFKDESSRTLMVAVIENGVSLMVCNLPVVVTATIRLRSKFESTARSRGEEPSFIRFATRPRQTMLSVQLTSLPDVKVATVNLEDPDNSTGNGDSSSGERSKDTADTSSIVDLPYPLADMKKAPLDSRTEEHNLPRSS